MLALPTRPRAEQLSAALRKLDTYAKGASSAATLLRRAAVGKCFWCGRHLRHPWAGGTHRQLCFAGGIATSKQCLALPLRLHRDHPPPNRRLRDFVERGEQCVCGRAWSLLDHVPTPIGADQLAPDPGNAAKRRPGCEGVERPKRRKRQ